MMSRKGDEQGRGKGRGEREGARGAAHGEGTARGGEGGMEGAGEVYVITPEAARGIDRLCIERFGLPSLVLMENAARHLCDVTLEALEDLEDPLVVIFCGPGNNGGDGLAAARHLDNAGVRVAVILSGEGSGLRGDAAVQYRVVKEMGVLLRTAGEDVSAAVAAVLEEHGPCDVAIDAVMGTGLSRNVDGVLRGMVEQINLLGKSGTAVIAVDVPSGLDATTGEPKGVAVKADVTVTFVGLKPGLSTLAAQAYVGDVVVADIGAPRELVRKLGTRLPTGDHAEVEGKAGEEEDGPRRR